MKNIKVIPPISFEEERKLASKPSHYKKGGTHTKKHLKTVLSPK